MNTNGKSNNPDRSGLAPRDGEKIAKTTPQAKNTGFMKPMQPSEDLAKIVGTEPLPRSEVTKKIWVHIQEAHSSESKGQTGNLG
jgi:upstream activation factor subunit UAF30